MTVLELTYDVEVFEHGKIVIGESATRLQVTDTQAKEILENLSDILNPKTNYSKANVKSHVITNKAELETAASAIELLKGRYYVQGSMKSIREVKEI
jgi:hypothetical protein